jgi:hypothetical protein
MSEFSDFFSTVTNRLAHGLGLKASDKQQLTQWKAHLAQSKADNHDALEKLKEEIQQVEQRIRLKKTKFDQAHGLTQKMIGREIEQVFRELDRKEKQADIVLSGIEANSLALDKVGELERALERGFKEGQLDAIAVQLEDTFAEVQQADNALKDLEKVGYRAPETASVDVEQRTRELEGTKPAKAALSEATLARLKQLEPASEG